MNDFAICRHVKRVSDGIQVHQWINGYPDHGITYTVLDSSKGGVSYTATGAIDRELRKEFLEVDKTSFSHLGIIRKWIKSAFKEMYKPDSSNDGLAQTNQALSLIFFEHDFIGLAHEAVKFSLNENTLHPFGKLRGLALQLEILATPKLLKDGVWQVPYGKIENTMKNFRRELRQLPEELRQRPDMEEYIESVIALQHMCRQANYCTTGQAMNFWGRGW